MSDLYLGRHVDPADLSSSDRPLRLEADRLTRHGVILGMTGSGKTGLGVGLLEEVALSGVPVLAVDPKGDLTNLALRFPEPRGADLEPWVDGAEAAREGLSTDDLADAKAARWREGLASWGVSPERQRAWRDDVDVRIVTPGSTAGHPVDVLGALASPPGRLGEDAEGLAAYVSGATRSLLGLVGIEADPLRDREAVLLAQLLHDAWTAGEAMPLERLLPAIVDPPFDRLGVFPLDGFFPRKDRTDLAMRLNAVVASPTFASWRQGEPLDLDVWLAPDRKRVTVLYLAHLDGPQRAFFLSTLLHAVVAWSRRQPGTSALRALLYLDEVMGLMPPHPKDPPTKGPLLTLFKQARAVGLGTVVCTQNPVDLDYKALSNAGTWMIGRLSTPQDRERVLDGLGAADVGLDRRALSDLLDRLPGRRFVLRDVAEDAPSVFQTRWVMSFLRGPLTRTEVAALVDATGREEDASSAPSASPAPAAPDDDTLVARPPTPGDLPTVYLTAEAAGRGAWRSLLDPHRRRARADGAVVYAPAVVATVAMHFDEGRDWDAERALTRAWFLADGDRRGVEIEDAGFVAAPQDGARFVPPPADLDEDREVTAFTRQVLDAVLQGETAWMYRHSPTRLVSKPGEDEAAFRARVEQALVEAADADIAALHEKVAKKVDALRDKIEDAEEARARYEADASAYQTQEIVNAGETLLSMFFGRRRSTSTMVTRRRQVTRAQQKVQEAALKIARLQEDLLDLEEETEDDLRAIRAQHAARIDAVEAIEVGLEKDDVDLRDVRWVWVPISDAV